MTKILQSKIKISNLVDKVTSSIENKLASFLNVNENIGLYPIFLIINYGCLFFSNFFDVGNILESLFQISEFLGLLCILLIFFNIYCLFAVFHLSDQLKYEEAQLLSIQGSFKKKPHNRDITYYEIHHFLHASIAIMLVLKIVDLILITIVNAMIVNVMSSNPIPHIFLFSLLSPLISGLWASSSTRIKSFFVRILINIYNFF